MTDRKPYLLRAIFDWLVDNNCTPYLLVARPDRGWVSGLPEHLLKDESVVLNVSPRAAPHFVIEKDVVSFRTRFSGQSTEVLVAMEAVAALFAQENQEGMMFDIDAALLERGAQQKKDVAKDAPKSSKKAPSHLKILK